MTPACSKTEGAGARTFMGTSLQAKTEMLMGENYGGELESHRKAKKEYKLQSLVDP